MMMTTTRNITYTQVSVVKKKDSVLKCVIDGCQLINQMSIADLARKRKVKRRRRKEGRKEKRSQLISIPITKALSDYTSNRKSAH